MATNLNLDDDLIREVLELSGHRTKREAVTEALKEYVARRKQIAALQLRGQIDFDPDYDYKEQRRRA